jgi:hypothetical protein
VLTLALATGLALAGHPDGDVTIKSAGGAAIVAGSNVPYSPKATCGGCHDYETDVTAVTKQQNAGTYVGAPYSVPVPQHGVSVGYHFQQGLNVAWGDTQRTFYGQLGSTSSPGMFGKL